MEQEDLDTMLIVAYDFGKRAGQTIAVRELMELTRRLLSPEQIRGVLAAVEHLEAMLGDDKSPENLLDDGQGGG